MASPVNSSGLLQIDNDGSGHTFNAGFTFTAGRDAVLTLGHFATGQSISGVTIGGTTATLISSANKVSGSENSARIYLAQNIAGGTADVVITYSGGTDHYISGSVEEWAAGVLESSAVDAGTANSAGGSSATPSASTAASTSQANTIVYAVMVTNTTSTNNNITGPTGYTVTWTEQDSTNHEGGRGAWIEESTTGTKTATFGMTSGGWGVAIVALKLASTAPVITAQPADQTVNNGATATFSVTATGATSYQWQDNSSGSFADISGATSSSYVTSAAAYSMQGRLYRCVVTNAGGSTNSNSAALFVAWNLTGTGPRAFPDLGGTIGGGTVDAVLQGTISGGGGVTGTLSVTLSNATLSSSGTTTIVGTLSRTISGDTLSASGTTTIRGTLSRTLSNDTLSASGSPVIVGTLAITLNNDTLSASGSIGSPVTGTVAVTLGNDTLSSSGTTTIVGTFSRTLLNDTLSSQGTTTVLGTLAKTLLDDTLAAAGSIGSAVSGTLNVTLNSDALAGQGTTTVIGSLSRTLSNDTMTGSGSVTVTGTLSVTLQNDTLTASGSSGTPVTGVATKLPMTGVGS